MTVDSATKAGVVYFHGPEPVFADHYDYREERAYMATLAEIDSLDVPTDRGAHAAASAPGKKKSRAQAAAAATRRSVAYATLAALEVRAARA
ncbi:hypothetical protein [Demequina salsinemoris]|uniref:hypothetical protein n=1 Tax=Demequina salsinemoris TaxID=577470 RepID=UPI00078370CB|nr:hypothetical protein [Demequina salsinemoris]